MASDFRSWLELYMSEKQARIQQLACASQQMNQTSAAVGVQQQAHIAQYTLECGDYCLPEQTQSGSAGSSTPDVGEPQPVEPAPRPVCCSDCGERIVDAYHFDRSGRCSKRPARPVCTCGQTVWNDARHYGEPVCADCRMQALHNSEIEHAPQQPIDARISAAQRSEPARDAADWDCWSTAGDES
jgi:hypothetical protein